jgi:hypothetical protein
MMENFAAKNAVTVVPHATNALSPIPDRIYVGGTGDITCRLMGDNADVVFKAVPVGTILPIRAQYIRATGTTATLMLALTD